MNVVKTSNLVDGMRQDELNPMAVERYGAELTTAKAVMPTRIDEKKSSLGVLLRLMYYGHTGFIHMVTV